MKIIDLKFEPIYVEKLAKWQHNEWSEISTKTFDERVAELTNHLNDEFIPSTFVIKDSEALGSAAIVAHDMVTKPELSPWLASVVIAPNNRGAGIGSKIVSYVMEQAKSTGIKTLYLYTPDRESFYQRLGWQTITKEKYRQTDVTIMSIDLTS